MFKLVSSLWRAEFCCGLRSPIQKIPQQIFDLEKEIIYMSYFKTAHPTDIATLAMIALTLLDLGYTPPELDPNDKSVVSHIGPHSTYTFSLTLRDDMCFDINAFHDRLQAYAAISSCAKPLAGGCDSFPAIIPAPYGEIDPATGSLPSQPLRNFTTYYVTVYLSTPYISD